MARKTRKTKQNLKPGAIGRKCCRESCGHFLATRRASDGGAVGASAGSGVCLAGAENWRRQVRFDRGSCVERSRVPAAAERADEADVGLEAAGLKIEPSLLEPAAGPSAPSPLRDSWWRPGGRDRAPESSVRWAAVTPAASCSRFRAQPMEQGQIVLDLLEGAEHGRAIIRSPPGTWRRRRTPAASSLPPVNSGSVTSGPTDQKLKGRLDGSRRLPWKPPSRFSDSDG